MVTHAMAEPKPSDPSPTLPPLKPVARRKRSSRTMARLTCHAILSLLIWTGANLFPYQPMIAAGYPLMAAVSSVLACLPAIHCMSYNPSAWQTVLLADPVEIQLRFQSKRIHFTGLVYTCVQLVPVVIGIYLFGFPLPFACLVPATVWVFLLPMFAHVFLVPRSTWAMEKTARLGWFAHAYCSLQRHLSCSQLPSTAIVPTPQQAAQVALFLTITALMWTLVNLFVGAFVALSEFPVVQVVVVFVFQTSLSLFRTGRSHFLLRQVPQERKRTSRQAWLLRHAAYFDFELCGAMFVGLCMPTIGSWPSGVVFMTSDAAGLVGGLAYFYATGGLTGSGRLLQVDVQALLIRVFTRTPTVIARLPDDAAEAGWMVCPNVTVTHPPLALNKIASLLPHDMDRAPPPLALSSSVMTEYRTTLPPAPSSSSTSSSHKNSVSILRTTIDRIPQPQVLLVTSPGHDTFYRNRVTSIASLVPTTVLTQTSGTVQQRQGIQVNMPSPTRILQLLLEVFVLDLIVRTFAGAYFFVFIIPITQFDWMLQWNPTVAYSYRPDPTVPDPVSNSNLYMGLTVLLTGFCGMMVNRIARRAFGRGLLGIARQLMRQPEIYMIVVGTFYMAPGFVLPGRHWAFESTIFDLMTGIPIRISKWDSFP
ncbi:hypothetical protein BC828DRAFT_377895 [Blastocladiella britannica]|nr:hypothetical protein BC828DRAFT_377895 [Blastocladiella britannica]